MTFRIHTSFTTRRVDSKDPVIESLFETLEKRTSTRLDWIASDSGGLLVKMKDRVASIEDEMRNQEGVVRFVCDGSIETGVHVSLLPLWVSPSRTRKRTTVTVVKVSLEVSLLYTSIVEFVADLGDLLQAWHGGATPDGISLTGYFSGRGRLPESIEKRLKKLPKTQSFPSIGSPEIPGQLDWINYFSEATCKTLGFPEVVRDREAFGVCEQTEAKAWIFVLTKEPIDLTREEHVMAVEQAYELFPIIGRRKGIE